MEWTALGVPSFLLGWVFGKGGYSAGGPSGRGEIKQIPTGGASGEVT